MTHQSDRHAQSPASRLWPFRRLPLKLLYRSLELSAKSTELLEQAMERGNFSDPEEAVQQAFLNQPVESR